jgi:hypothetical protein
MAELFLNRDKARRGHFYRNSICSLLVYNHHGVCLLHRESAIK